MSSLGSGIVGQSPGDDDFPRVQNYGELVAGARPLGRLVDTAGVTYGRWIKDGAIWRPVGTLDLDHHPNTQHGIVASGSGTSYVVAVGHTLPAEGVLRPWDVSAAAKAGAGDVAFTRIGTAVTLASARALVANDLFYFLPDGTRTGPFDIDEAGDVVPLSGTFVFDGGPKATNGITLIYGIVNPRDGRETLVAGVECVTSTPTDGMETGIATLRAADLSSHFACGWTQIAGVDRPFCRHGAVLAPAGFSGALGGVYPPEQIALLHTVIGSSVFWQGYTLPAKRRVFLNVGGSPPPALALILIAEPGGAEAVSIRVKTIANL